MVKQYSRKKKRNVYRGGAGIDTLLTKDVRAYTLKIVPYHIPINKVESIDGNEHLTQLFKSLQSLYDGRRVFYIDSIDDDNHVFFKDSKTDYVEEVVFYDGNYIEMGVGFIIEINLAEHVADDDEGLAEVVKEPVADDDDEGEEPPHQQEPAFDIFAPINTLLTKDDRAYTLKIVPYHIPSNEVKSIDGNEHLTQVFKSFQSLYDGRRVFYIDSIDDNNVFFRESKTDYVSRVVFNDGNYIEMGAGLIIEINLTEPVADDDEGEEGADEEIEPAKASFLDEGADEEIEPARASEHDKERTANLTELIQQDYVLRFKYKDDADQTNNIQLLKKFKSGGRVTDDMFDSLTSPLFNIFQRFIYFEYDLNDETITVKCQERFCLATLRDSTNPNHQSYSEFLEKNIKFLKHQLKNNGVTQELRKYNEHKTICIAAIPTSKLDLLHDPHFHMDGGSFVSVTSKNLHEDYNFGTEYIFSPEKLNFEERIGMPFLTRDYKNAVPHLKQCLQTNPNLSIGVSHIVNNGDTFIFHDGLGVHTIPSNRTEREENGVISFSMRLKTGFTEDNVFPTPSKLKLCQNTIDMTQKESERHLIVLIYHPIDKLDKYFAFFVEGYETFEVFKTFPLALEELEPEPVSCITLLNDPETTKVLPNKVEPYITQDIQIPAREFFDKLYNIEAGEHGGSCLMIDDFRLLTRGGTKTRTTKKFKPKHFSKKSKRKGKLKKRRNTKMKKY